MKLSGIVLAFVLCLSFAGCGTEIGSVESVMTETDDSPSETTTTTQATTTATTTAETTVQSTSAGTTAAPADDSSEPEQGILTSPEDIGLHDTDGNGFEYEFTYGGETFRAVYTYDNWKIIDSYLITNSADMTIICEALISYHPIHGRDGESYRTAEDMAYEWQEHNFVFELLPEDSRWKTNTRDVDLHPEDQGKTALEMAYDRLKNEH